MTQPPMNPNYQMQPQGSSGLSIATLVMGIIAIALTVVLFCFPFVGAFIGLIAIILGAVALSQSTPAAVAGKGKAKTGLVLGIVSILIMVGILVAGHIGLKIFKGKLDDAMKKANEEKQMHDQTQPATSQSCLPLGDSPSVRRTA